jgi:hypothetical protein
MAYLKEEDNGEGNFRVLKFGCVNTQRVSSTFDRSSFEFFEGTNPLEGRFFKPFPPLPLPNPRVSTKKLNPR